MASLDKLAEVFAALQDGTFLERLSDFSDKQISPFLPSLFMSTLMSVDNLETCNESVLSRIVSFEDANRLQTIAAVPFSSIEQKLLNSTAYNVVINDQVFRSEDEEEKVYQVAMTLIAPENEDDPSGEVLPFISEDITDEAALIFSFVVQMCPSLCTARKLAFMAVAYNNAPMVIAKVIANNPELFYPVLHELCDVKLARTVEESPRGRQRTYIFALLLSLCPGAGEYIVSNLLETKGDAPLALKLAVEMLNDDSLIALIPPEIINRSRPLAQLLHRSAARHKILSLYQRLATMAVKFLNDGTPIADTESFIICLCTLYSSSSYKPASEDAELLVSYLITSSTHFAHDCHLIVAVAIVMGIPAVNMGGAFTERIVKWLASLREMCANGGNSRYTLSHTLLFICTCLSTKKTEQLVPFLTNIIKMKVVVPPKQIALLQSIVVDAGFTERELALMCTRLPVTSNLSADSADVSIPAYCVNELLQGNIFAKNGVEITSWMERQLRECSTPLHPLVPGLLDRLAIMSVADNVKTISTKFIEEAFAGPLTAENTFNRRIVCAFFLLAYRLHYDMASAVDRQEEEKAKREGRVFFRPQRMLLYPDSMYTTIPLRYLLGVAEHLDSSYSSIRGWLLRMAAELFPYMQPSTESVEIVRLSLRENGKQRRIEEADLERQLQGANPLPAMRRLEAAGLSEQFRHLRLIARCTLHSLRKGASRECVTVTTRLWLKMESVVPRSLIEITAREWLAAGGCREIVPVEKIYEIPPLLFRVDRKLFSSPPHLECFLRALSFFVQAGRTRLGKEINACPDREDFNKVDRELVSSTSDHSQAATIVHALVEIIDPMKFKENEASLCLVRLDELTRLACEEIHQMFITDRQLLKLVLWQMLPLHLLPTLIDSIPSLHVALEMVNEMLATPGEKSEERRLFAVAMTAQISHKYRVIQSAHTMELVVDVLHTMIRHCPSAIHLSLMQRVVPWLEQTIEVFPQLAGDITQILMSTSAIAKSRLALNPAAISTSTPAETRLIHSIDESITRAMANVTV